MAKCPFERLLVTVAETCKPPRLLACIEVDRAVRALRDIVAIGPREKIGRHRRDIGECENQRPEYRCTHREGHWPEHPPLDALQREDRDVDRDDDCDPEYDWSSDLERRLLQDITACSIR